MTPQKAFITVTVIALSALILAIAVIWKAFALSVLWSWFAVPAFALPPITVPQAVGVALTAALLTHGTTAYKNEDHWRSAAAVFFGPALALLVGWVATLFL